MIQYPNQFSAPWGLPNEQRANGFLLSGFLCMTSVSFQIEIRVLDNNHNTRRCIRDFVLEVHCIGCSWQSFIFLFNDKVWGSWKKMIEICWWSTGIFWSGSCHKMSPYSYCLDCEISVHSVELENEIGSPAEWKHACHGLGRLPTDTLHLPWKRNN